MAMPDSSTGDPFDKVLGGATILSLCMLHFFCGRIAMVRKDTH